MAIQVRAVRRSNKVAVVVGLVGGMFTLLSYEQTLMSSMNSTLLGLGILLVALAIKEFDLLREQPSQPSKVD